MKIDKIEILIGYAVGTDRVSLYTNLPSPFPVGISHDNLVVGFEVQKSKGVEYVINNFKGIPIKIIDTDNGHVRWVNE